LILNTKYFEKEFRKVPVENLWKLIEELLFPHSNVFDKNTMSYEEVFELCVVLRHLMKYSELIQIDILKRRLSDLIGSKYKTLN